MKTALTTGMLALALAATPAGAEEKLTVGLEQAYTAALQNNFGLRSQQAGVKGEEQATREAWAGVLPQVDATASYGQSRFTRDFGVNDSITDTDEHTRYDVNLSQVVYSGRTFGAIGRAQAGEERAREELRGRELETGYQAIEAYYSTLALAREIEVVEKERASHRRRLDQMQNMLDRGLATRADVLDAQATMDQTEATLAGLNTEYRAARQNFTAVTGLDLDEVALAPANEDRWQQTPQVLQTDWLTLALANSGQLRVARADLEFVSETRDYERSGHYPEIYLNARYTENDTFATSLREETRVEVQVKLPLYKGGATNARTRQAAYREEASKLELQHKEQQVRVEITRLVQGLEGSHQKILALQTARESAAESLQAAERGFASGVRSLTDLLDARTRLSNTERDLVRETYTNLQMQFELQQVAGTLNERPFKEGA
ncbi:MAG: TolC family outer membrane protein [Alteromonadaceae bacterium]|nr:TolC family outer membrane protein [Alteromonadaceae bacterium]